MTSNPKCLKCGSELSLNEEGIAPVLCHSCAGVAGKRARRGLATGTIKDYPATTVLMAINIGVFVAMVFTGVSITDPSFNALVRWGGNYGPYVTGGEYWRLATATFLHGGIIHILFNMWCLVSLGPLCERFFGKWQTICIYLLTGIGGFLLSIAHTPTQLSVGSSGSLFGMAAALLAGVKFGELSLSAGQKRSIVSSLIMFIILSVSLGSMRDDIDNMAHLGGFVAGLLVGLPLGSFARKGQLYKLGTIVAMALVMVAGGHQLVQDHGAEGLLERADAATDHKDYGKAVRLLEKYRSIQPDDADMLTWLGDLYAATDQRDKAAEAYQHALKINPDDEDAKDGLDDLRRAALTSQK